MLTVKTNTGEVLQQFPSFRRALRFAERRACHRTHRNRFERILIVNGAGDLLRVL
jgi:hypothetical protein